MANYDYESFYYHPENVSDLAHEIFRLEEAFKYLIWTDKEEDKKYWNPRLIEAIEDCIGSMKDFISSYEFNKANPPELFKKLAEDVEKHSDK